MRNVSLAVLAGIVSVGLAISVIAAQGNGGRGCGMGAANMGMSCPMMKNAQAATQNQNTANMACPMGKMQRAGQQGGWWNNVTPTTPEQKAFVEQVKSLHKDISAKRLEITKLQQDKADQQSIKKAQHQLKESKAKLQKLMQDNREIRQQLTPSGKAAGSMKMNQKGCGMMNQNANCPMVQKGTCPMNATGNCSACPKATPSQPVKSGK